MSDIPTPVPGPLAPYCTGAELAAHLGGVPAETDALESCAYAATAAVWAVVNDPGWDETADPAVPVPEGVKRVTLMVAAELWKAGAGVGDFQLDGYQSTPATIGTNVVRRYYAMLAPWRAVGGMVG